MESNFFNIIAEQARKKRDAADRLERTPYSIESYSVESLSRIIDIRKNLNRISNNPNINVALEDAKEYLNSFSWKHRFTSGDVVSFTERDSLYFVTPENFSIRLKTSNIQTNNIRKVIQPFMEKIFFEDASNVVYFEPQIGFTVQEYTSKEFLSLQEMDTVETPFQSDIRQYKLPTGLHIQNAPNGLEHTGSRVNSII
jgi:hypothetical protein